MGQDIEPLGILALNPGFLLPYAFTIPLVNGKSMVDPRIRLLATDLASHINGCAWCMDFGRRTTAETARGTARRPAPSLATLCG